MKATVWLCLLVLVLVQQVVAGPVPGPDPARVGCGPPAAPRRVARMSPLWRIMNSKPLGAYCHHNYECSTALCSGGRCSSGHRSISPVKY